MSLQKYLNLNKEIFIDAIKKINLTVFIIALIDYIFYSLAYFSSQFWFSKVLERYGAVNLDALSELTLESIAAQAQGLYYFLVYSAALLLISLFAFSALSKAIAWALVSKTKITRGYILKFTLAKLVWNLPIAAIMALGFIIFQPQGAFILFSVAALLWIYFSSIIYALLAKNPGISEIKTGIRLGIKKIHCIIIPYAAIITGILLIRMLYLTGRTQELLIASGILLLFYLAIGRYYIYEMVSRIEK